MVAGVSANLPSIPPPISAGGGAPLPAQTTTTQVQISSSPVRLTVTRLVGGETLISCQQIGGSSCLSQSDVQPVPGDPQATVRKLQKVLSEASDPGSSSSGNSKLLAQARASLAEAQSKVQQKQQGIGDDSGGVSDAGSEPDNAADRGGGSSNNPLVSNYGSLFANQGTHAPQGVNANSVSVFA